MLDIRDALNKDLKRAEMEIEKGNNSSVVEYWRGYRDALVDLLDAVDTGGGAKISAAPDGEKISVGTYYDHDD